MLMARPPVIHNPTHLPHGPAVNTLHLNYAPHNEFSFLSRAQNMDCARYVYPVKSPDVVLGWLGDVSLIREAVFQGVFLQKQGLVKLQCLPSSRSGAQNLIQCPSPGTDPSWCGHSPHTGRTAAVYVCQPSRDSHAHEPSSLCGGGYTRNQCLYYSGRLQTCLAIPSLAPLEQDGRF